MDEKVLNAALAGLLHDVGKFSQRAGIGMSESRNAEAKQDFGYVHALASYDFVKSFVPESWREDLSGVAYHHRPRNQREAWTQLADHLSAMEREDDDNKVPRMLSVFSRLKKHQHDQYLPLTRLNPTKPEQLFPKDRPEFSTQEWRKEWENDYAKLWEEFESECKYRGLASMTDREAYLESIFASLQDFTWSIPSAFWNSVPDVSLFDHLRTTAAIAACLAADDRSEEWCKNAKENDDEICLLVGGDLSGLQDFIYTLASKGAMKSLRARSFYVQLITEALALAIVRDLGLPITNLLYVGGGVFQLLAPMNTKAKAELENTVQDLTERLLVVHNGKLGLTVKHRVLKYADFKDFGAARDELETLINKAKRQPFASTAAANLLKAIGEPIGLGGDPEKFCKVTGEDGKTIEERDDDGNMIIKSKFVWSLEELGSLLPHANHIAYIPIDRKKQSVEIATSWHEALHVFGLNVWVIPDKKRAPSASSNVLHVWQLKPTFDHPKEESWLEDFKGRSVVSYRPFARLTPFNDEAKKEIKTTDDLTQPKCGSNFKRWGVLRLDVDNLGKMFKEGFEGNASLSRVSSLSLAMRLFFEGWLPELAKGWGDDQEDLSQHLYIQYAGGDDVFVVGSWDVLPKFAMRIRQSFEQYVAGNPNLTISGGIALADAGFPLYQAAQQADDAESAAKSFERAGKIKDALTFLDTTLGWDELSETEERANLLAKVVPKELPHSALQTILSLTEQINKRDRQHFQGFLRKGRLERYELPKVMFGPWTWTAAYQLTRIRENLKKKGRNDGDSIINLIDKVQQIFLDRQSNKDDVVARSKFKSIALAARWAQYLSRGG